MNSVRHAARSQLLHSTGWNSDSVYIQFYGTCSQFWATSGTKKPINSSPTRAGITARPAKHAQRRTTSSRTRRESMDPKLRSPFSATFRFPTDSQKPPKIDFLRPSSFPKSIFCNSLPIFGTVAIIRRVCTKNNIVL